MPIEKIVVLEDDKAMRRYLEEALRGQRYNVSSASTLAEARGLLAKDSFDLLLSDMRLPDGQSLELLKELQQRPQKPLIVVMTGYATVESAVECMRSGAFDYLIKPFSIDQLEIVLKKAEEFTQLLKVNQFLSHEEDADTGCELLGKTECMEQLRQLIRKVARTEATVLIQGESGTGKELVGRELYRQSPRANAPFIRVNCAAIPESLIESEFFGHEKGSFTGALNKREGRFELAHGGTILLDEVSEIPLGLQAKLLRVLQERELERVGGNRTIKVDVRVIATTNRRLEESIERNEFRQDLFFRLNVVPIPVPPLRERREDIPYLAGQFTQQFSRKHGVRIRGLSEDCLKALHDHPWPGNVRELQNVIERAVILCGENEMLDAGHLGLTRLRPAGATLRPSPLAKIGAPIAFADEFPTLSELEKRHILAALDHCKGNRTHAAKLLDISIRTLRNKLNEYSGRRGKEAATKEQEESSQPAESKMA
jgi:two-component system, NtrC family, response regulator AtoC